MCALYNEPGTALYDEPCDYVFCVNALKYCARYNHHLCLGRVRQAERGAGVRGEHQATGRPALRAPAHGGTQTLVGFND